MRRQTNAPFLRRQAEVVAHRAAEPRIGTGLGRPGTFVQSAKNDQIGGDQARFQRPQNRNARVTAIARAHRTRRHERRQQPGVGPGIDIAQRRRAFTQFRGKQHQGLARLAPPQAFDTRLLIRRRHGLGQGEMGIDQRCK